MQIIINGNIVEVEMSDTIKKVKQRYINNCKLSVDINYCRLYLGIKNLYNWDHVIDLKISRNAELRFEVLSIYFEQREAHNKYLKEKEDKVRCSTLLMLRYVGESILYNYPRELLYLIYQHTVDCNCGLEEGICRSYTHKCICRCYSTETPYCKFNYPARCLADVHHCICFDGLTDCSVLYWKGEIDWVDFKSMCRSSDHWCICPALRFGKSRFICPSEKHDNDYRDMYDKEIAEFKKMNKL